MFRNLIIFNLPPNWSMTAGDLEAELSRHPLMPCTGMNLQTRGWVAPRENGALVESVEKHLLIALGAEMKLLPGAVVRQAAEERAAEIEKVKGYKPGRKMMREIKEQVTVELLPRAFVRRRSVQAWIDVDGGRIVVDSPSHARAEELIEVLRNSLGGELAVTFPEPSQSPSSMMTAWLAGGEAPGRFALGDACQLIGTDESKPTVQYLRHGLEGNDVRRHISEGKFATRVALTWDDKVSLVLTDKLQVKKIAYLGLLNDSQESLSKEDKFAVDFTLMTGEFGALLTDLVSAIGAKA